MNLNSPEVRKAEYEKLHLQCVLNLARIVMARNASPAAKEMAMRQINNLTPKENPPGDGSYWMEDVKKEVSTFSQWITF